MAVFGINFFFCYRLKITLVLNSTTFWGY